MSCKSGRPVAKASSPGVNVRANSSDARLISECDDKELLVLVLRLNFGVWRGASYAVYRSLLPVAAEEALDDGRSAE